jgi:hypothetical protein
MYRVSVPREFAYCSTASHPGEREAVLRVDLEGQQVIWPQECHQAERHIASSTLRAGTGSQDGTLVPLGCGGDEDHSFQGVSGVMMNR